MENKKSYVKWQTIAGTGTIGLFVFLSLLFNLYGMEATHDGDKECLIDCYSEIRVTSSYWSVRVEHAGDKDVVFKKASRSRTLWVNLDKIEELVTTNPEVQTDILVGTISRYSTVKHDEYGYLRPLKDGDYLISRNSKSNPSPSRIILHGSKSPETTVKWSFFLDDNMMQEINIDPLWIGQDDVITDCITEEKSVMISSKVLKNVSREEYYLQETCEEVEVYHEKNDSYDIDRVCESTKQYRTVIEEKIVPHNVLVRQLECKKEKKVYYDNEQVTFTKEKTCSKINSTSIECDTRYDGDGDGTCQRLGGETCMICTITKNNGWLCKDKVSQ